MEGWRIVMNNICKFIPVRPSPDELHIINFVKEQHRFHKEPHINAAYLLYLVMEGRGTLYRNQARYELKKGSLFLTLPAKEFGIENIEGLKCMYISFIGLRGIALAERIGIQKAPGVWNGFEELIPFWEDTLRLASGQNIDLFAEGVLLYTLARIEGIQTKQEEGKKEISPIQSVKKYVDDNYSSHDMSLDLAAAKLGYNKKYLSDLFKKELKITFTAYLRTVLIQNACYLIEQGVISVKKLAYLSGFSDPLYFSKVFKDVMGESPRSYIQKEKRRAAINLAE